MSKPTFVKKARADVPNSDIKAGESYWWWKFRHGGKHVSRTKPARHQLTQSAFKSSLWAIQDEVSSELTPDAEDLDGRRDGIVGELENLRDECQSSLDNMPEGLQEGDSGQLLQTRIDSLEEAINTMQSVDTEAGPDEAWQEIQDAVSNVDEG